MSDFRQIAEKILDLAKQSADAAEVFCAENENRKAEFENNRLKYITTKSVRGIGLRVIVNGRIGFSSTTDLRRPEQLVEYALESAKYGQQAKFELPANVEPNGVKIHDQKVADFAIEEGVKHLEASIERVLAAEPRAQVGGDVSKSIGRQFILNTAGLDAGFEFSRFRNDLSALIVRDGSLLWVGDHDSSCQLQDVWDKHIEKVIGDIQSARNELVPEAGKYPIIFTPDAIGSLLATFEQGVNGKLVQKKISPLIDKLGEKVVDTKITITDDGTIDYASGSCPFDDEGIAVGQNVLFDKGVLKQYLYDLQTAGLMNTTTTGSGMRGFSTLPQPGNTNLVIAAGEMPYREMLSNMKRGLIVDQLLGAGQSNTLAGEFSVNVDLGFLVENGEIVGRVKDCMLAGNAFEAFNKVIALGTEQIVKGSLITPHLYIDDLNVASGG